MHRRLRFLRVGSVVFWMWVLATGCPLGRAEPARVEGRWLLAIETSADMAPRREGLVATLEQLFRSGFDQRLRAGDTIGVWTFHHTVTTGQFPLQTWQPETGPDMVRLLRAFLESRSWEHHGEPGLVFPLAEAVLAGSARFNLIILCSGERELRGTPFDAPVNEVLRRIRREQRRNRQPVVLVFRAEAGRWIAHAVGQPPWWIRIPETPGDREPPPAAGAATAGRTPTNGLPPAAHADAAVTASQTLAESRGGERESASPPAGRGDQPHADAAATGPSRVTTQALAQATIALANARPSAGPTPEPEEHGAPIHPRPVSAPEPAAQRSEDHAQSSAEPAHPGRVPAGSSVPATGPRVHAGAGAAVAGESGPATGPIVTGGPDEARSEARLSTAPPADPGKAAVENAGEVRESTAGAGPAASPAPGARRVGGDTPAAPTGAAPAIDESPGPVSAQTNSGDGTARGVLESPSREPGAGKGRTTLEGEASAAAQLAEVPPAGSGGSSRAWFLGAGVLCLVAAGVMLGWCRLRRGPARGSLITESLNRRPPLEPPAAGS
ncbi:MAG: hypothetical protein KatS3mg132_867 [Limisphaera sp.]|nr:MAG: hypothetical protein KatS3mg132_867 [Limisphaera sp.]